MNELQGYILGDASPAKWEAIGILANVMVFIMMGKRVNARDKLSPSTPIKFSWKWLVADNLSSFLRTQLSIFAFSRVALVWVKPEYTVIFAFATGLISDQLMVIFGFAKDKIIVRVKTMVTKWFGGDKVEVTKTETTTITPVDKTKTE